MSRSSRSAGSATLSLSALRGAWTKRILESEGDGRISIARSISRGSRSITLHSIRCAPSYIKVIYPLWRIGMADATSMEFTGERFVPTLDGQIKYEHLHRYALVLDFAAGKSVLDIACGEGYGAALMACVAERVVGVDISQPSIEHARRSYYYQNLEFLIGACESIPLPDAAVDLVTSFETIEHHDRHEEMMSEIKRVMRPGGVLIISSPNRLTYSDEPNYSNPFHVRELYYDEFHALLSRYFKHVHLFGQRIAAGSVAYMLQGADPTHLRSFAGDTDHLGNKVSHLSSPLYFIAVC